MSGFYVDTLTMLIARTHPSITRVTMEQAEIRDVLIIRVEADLSKADEIRASLKRSEPSFCPKGFGLRFDIVAAADA